MMAHDSRGIFQPRRRSYYSGFVARLRGRGARHARNLSRHLFPHTIHGSSMHALPLSRHKAWHSRLGKHFRAHDECAFSHARYSAWYGSAKTGAENEILRPIMPTTTIRHFRIVVPLKLAPRDSTRPWRITRFRASSDRSTRAQILLILVREFLSKRREARHGT